MRLILPLLAAGLSVLGAKFTNLDLMNRLPNEVVKPIYDIYTEALDAYKSQQYSKAVTLFEQAIVSNKLRNTLEINCRNRCEENPLKYAINRHLREADKFNLGPVRLQDLLNDSPKDEYTAFGELMERVSCLKTCREEHPFYSILEYDRLNPTKWITDDFKKRLPYNYLQFAYYKTGKFVLACQAAMTYYNGGNTVNEEAQDNMKFYLRIVRHETQA